MKRTMLCSLALIMVFALVPAAVFADWNGSSLDNVVAHGPTVKFVGCGQLLVRWENIPSPLDILLPPLYGWAKVARSKNGGVESFWLDPDARNNGRLSIWRGHFAYVGPGLYSVRYATLGGNLYIINEHPEERLSCRARIHLPGMKR